MKKLGIDDWELPILNVKHHDPYKEYTMKKQNRL